MGKPRLHPDHLCEVCEAPFRHRYSGTNQFCSYACRNRSRGAPPRNLICPTCSTPFTSRIHRATTYCSRRCARIDQWKNNNPVEAAITTFCACGCGELLFNKTLWDYAAGRPRRFLPHHKAKIAPVSKPCLGCGTAIILPPWRSLKRTFCTTECSRKHRIINPLFHRRTMKVVRPCPICSKPYSATQREIDTGRHASCSSKCSRILVGIKRTSSPSMCPQTQRRRILKERGRRCELCGYDKVPDIVTVHHKDENRLNGASDNLLVLCWNCHMELHFYAKTGPFKETSRAAGRKTIPTNTLSRNERAYDQAPH